MDMNYYIIVGGTIMETKEKSNERHNVFAIGLIVIGIIFLFENLDIIVPFDIWGFWPAVFVLIGISLLTKKNSSSSNSLTGLVFLIIGGYLLLENFDFVPYFSIDFSMIWPILLILFGLRLVFDNSKHRSK